VLFGPPGTGKTSFARAAASRLGWPFVELFPSRLAGESPAGLAWRANFDKYERFRAEQGAQSYRVSRSVTEPERGPHRSGVL
jgi:MoxR-like ATPase